MEVRGLGVVTHEVLRYEAGDGLLGKGNALGRGEWRSGTDHDPGSDEEAAGVGGEAEGAVAAGGVDEAGAAARGVEADAIGIVVAGHGPEEAQ